MGVPSLKKLPRRRRDDHTVHEWKRLRMRMRRLYILYWVQIDFYSIFPSLFTLIILPLIDGCTQLNCGLLGLYQYQ